VTAAGFTSQSIKGIRVELSKTSTVNVSVQVGTVSSTVEVTEAAALIDTTTSQIQNTYEAKLAADLPMAANPNGGIYNLALIGAGVASSGGVVCAARQSAGAETRRSLPHPRR